MKNIALDKKIQENWKDSSLLTNGDYKNYSGKGGFASAHWPKYLTLDLEEVFEIETIRFLLYDKDTRLYKYRLLTSEDSNNWDVHFDTQDKGYQSWQEFNFSPKIKARYIRLHCLWNSANAAFHIIELQAFNEKPETIQSNTLNKREISTNKEDNIVENGDGLPITSQMNQLANSLEKLISENDQLLNPEPFTKILQSIRTQVNDVNALESSIDSIRREILNPVQQELEAGRKLGKFSVWGFYVGFAGIIVSIFAILNGIFNWV